VTNIDNNPIVIQIEGITKFYQMGTETIKALNGIDLEIRKNEYMALMGPSGSGKSTLLNLIGGLDTPTNGSVIISDTDIAKLSANQLIEFRLQHIGFVFQAYNLIPVLTSKENVEFIMLMQNRSKKEREERAISLLKAVGLDKEIDRRPVELSGGQQQRVAVARALASKPDFVLADEPTANLDSKSAENLLDIMERLNKEEDITFLFSTHDARVVKRARRVITLEDGLVASDT